MMITLELSFCWSWDTKLDQTDLNFLYVLLKDVSYNFYFGIKPSYLMKLGERGMPIKLLLISALIISKYENSCRFDLQASVSLPSKLIHDMLQKQSLLYSN
jgi:hypothetical protein